VAIPASVLLGTVRSTPTSAPSSNANTQALKDSAIVILKPANIQPR